MRQTARTVSAGPPVTAEQLHAGVDEVVAAEGEATLQGDAGPTAPSLTRLHIAPKLQIDNVCSQNFTIPTGNLIVTQDTSASCPLTSDVAGSDVVGTAEQSVSDAPTGVRRCHGGCPVSPAGYDAPPAPLGPDSLTWRYFGDWRGMLQGPWAGSMQNMHPQLGAAVIDHSTFFRERWPRLLRSLYPIGGVVFDGDRAPMYRRRGPRLPHRHQGRRRTGPPLPRVEPRRLLLGARHLLCRHHSCGRTVLRRI